MDIGPHVKSACKVDLTYCTRTIITCSWFETALDFKPRILGPTFFRYVQMVFDINLPAGVQYSIVVPSWVGN